jgi:biopolymer transport protein ExbD
MSGRKKKGNPDLNVVSFCDIVTVSMVAMFMALIIVIDQALRTPEIRPTPLASPTTNAPVFFECRNNQVYVIDRRELLNELQRSTREMRTKSVGQTEAFLQEAMEQDIGNRFYRMDIGFLMMGIVALIPRPNVDGVPEDNLDYSTNAYDPHHGPPRHQLAIRGLPGAGRFIPHLPQAARPDHAARFPERLGVHRPHRAHHLRGHVQPGEGGVGSAGGR